MNTHRRYQTIRVIKDGMLTTITRTVRNIRLSELLTEIGETTIDGQTVTVERREDGKQWREVKNKQTTAPARSAGI